MKTRSFQKMLLAVALFTALVLFNPNLLAQDTPAATATAPANFTYGAEQVLQLTKAKVSDSTIVSYVKNSGNAYNLDAAAILYLRQQGVSDPVIIAMLDQHNRPVAAPAPTQPAATATGSAQTSTVVTQPTVTYIQSPPATTTYVVQSPPPVYYNYYDYYPSYSYYPYYRGYWGYSYPALSFSFGFGHSFRGGGYYGGYHGGGGGGFHGGGHGHR